MNAPISRPAPSGQFQGRVNLRWPLFLETLGIISVCELGIMFVLPLILPPGTAGWIEALVDTTILALTSGPLLFRRFQRHHARQQRLLQAGIVERTENLKQSNAELKASEHRLRVILETEPECVKQLAADGTLLEINPAGLRMIEAGRLEQAVGRSIHALVAPEHQAMFRALNQAVFRGESKVAEFEIIGLKGTRRWVRTHACPLRDLEGKIVAHLAVTGDITARKESEKAVAALHRQLLDTSRRAGMADVAGSVLHNVGNVLNSVNISSNQIAAALRRSSIGDVGRVAGLLRQHEADLASYLTSDPKGRQIPAFLGRLAAALDGESAKNLAELESLTTNVDHIKQIISMQQGIARSGGVLEPVAVPDLFEQALAINLASLDRHAIEVVRDFAALPQVVLDRHQVLQVLVNLISNAKYAMLEKDSPVKRLTLRALADPACPGFVLLQVSDTGTGIRPGHIPRLFTQGFTTKEDGHGFGLHSCALAAKAMGGLLEVHSDGEGRGAVFTLHLRSQTEELRAVA